MINKRTVGMNGYAEDLEDAQSPVFMTTIGRIINDQGDTKKEPIRVVILKNFKIYVDCYLDEVFPSCDIEIDNCTLVYKYDYDLAKEEINSFSGGFIMTRQVDNESDQPTFKK